MNDPISRNFQRSGGRVLAAGCVSRAGDLQLTERRQHKRRAGPLLCAALRDPAADGGRGRGGAAAEQYSVLPYKNKNFGSTLQLLEEEMAQEYGDEQPFIDPGSQAYEAFDYQEPHAEGNVDEMNASYQNETKVKV